MPELEAILLCALKKKNDNILNIVRIFQQIFMQFNTTVSSETSSELSYVFRRIDAIHI